MIVCILLTVSLVNQSALANCNWNDIKRKQDNTFVYTSDCHLEVKRLLDEQKLREEQVKELKGSIKLKDLALDTQEERLNRWRDATYRMEDRILKLDKANKYENWIWFGIGIVVMGAATYGAGQLRR